MIKRRAVIAGLLAFLLLVMVASPKRTEPHILICVIILFCTISMICALPEEHP